MCIHYKSFVGWRNWQQKILTKSVINYSAYSSDEKRQEANSQLNQTKINVCLLGLCGRVSALNHVWHHPKAAFGVPRQVVRRHGIVPGGFREERGEMATASSRMMLFSISFCFYSFLTQTFASSTKAATCTVLYRCCIPSIPGNLRFFNFTNWISVQT